MKKKKKLFRISILFSIILTLVMALSGVMLVMADILPNKYLALVILALVLLLYGLLCLLLKPKYRNWLKYTAMVFSALLMIALGFVDFYMFKTYDFMQKINKLGKAYEEYYVLIAKNSQITKLNDLTDKYVGTYIEETQVYNDAIKELDSKVKVDRVALKSVSELTSALFSNEVSAILISKIQKEQALADDADFDKKVTVLETIEVEQTAEEAGTSEPTNAEIFTIYISGIDTYGDISLRCRSDVNMVAIVNTSTHEILLVSIPRDYYVQLHGTKGYKDKLTHAGIYGINMSVQTIEDLLDIDLNYYLRVNFSTLVKVVDVIGGIDVYSDIGFKPWTNQNMYIKAGTNHMDGEMALAFARERKAYEEGDRHRIQNQQAVLTAIIKKLTSSTALLTKYNALLDSVSSSFQTNFSVNELTSIIKQQLSTMPTWNIKYYSLDGTDMQAYTYSMGQQLLYVMKPDETTVKQAHDYITGMLEGKTLEAIGVK